MEASGRAISAHARLLNSGRNADLIRPEESTRLILFADTVLTPAGVTWSPRGPPGRDKIDHPREAHDVGIALSQQARRSRLWQIERIMASWPDRPAGFTACGPRRSSYCAGMTSTSRPASCTYVGPRAGRPACIQSDQGEPSTAQAAAGHDRRWHDGEPVCLRQ